MAMFEKKEAKSTSNVKTVSTNPDMLRVAEQTLKRPRLTEKSFLSNELNQYVFQIAKDATKKDVRLSIEAVYGVEVEKVRTITVPRKARNYGRFRGWKSGIKKAVVTLKKGQELPIFNKGTE